MSLLAALAKSAEGVEKDLCRGKREARGEDPDPGVLSLEIPSVDRILCISESLLASPRWSQPPTINSRARELFMVRLQFAG